MPGINAASLAKITIFAGLSMMVIGVLLFFADKIPFLWRLPGDIYIERKRFSFYFPITSCIIISLVLSAILYFSIRKQ